MSQFILSDAELARIYSEIASLEAQICDLKATCFPECSNTEAEDCVDINIDKVLVVGGVDVETTTYYVDIVGPLDIQDARITVSIGNRSPKNLPFRLIALVGGSDVVLIESSIDAGYLHSIVEVPVIQGTSVLSLETIVEDCPPQGLKINICGISCGDVVEVCEAPPSHCSVFQYGTTPACSLFE